MTTYRLQRVDGLDEEHAWTLTNLNEQLFAPGTPGITPDIGAWWLAYSEDDGKPVAFAGIQPSKQFPRSTGYLCRSGVLKPHRGQGLQRRLIYARELFARRVGWNYTVTDTTDNVASANSLISAGYKLYKPTQPWAFATSLYWIKEL